MSKIKPAVLKRKLNEYLTIQGQIKDLEERQKELKAELFSADNVDSLPDTVDCGGQTYNRQERKSSISITMKMIKESGLDVDMILPTATFSATACSAIYGKSGVSRIQATDTYVGESERGTVTVFYKKA